MQSSGYLLIILAIVWTSFSLGEKSVQNQAEQIQVSVFLNRIVIDQKQPLLSTTGGYLSVAIVHEKEFRKDPELPIGMDMTLARSDHAVKPTNEFKASDELEKFKIEELLKYSQSGDRLVLELTNCNKEFVAVFSIK